MINRRHIRLKVMQYLYSFQFIENDDTKVHKKYFNDCFSSVNSLFIMLVSLVIELQKKSQKQLNISKKSISGIQNKRYLIYIEEEDSTMLWKSIDSMPCMIEFDLNF